MRTRGRARRRRAWRAVRMLEPSLLLLLHHSPVHGYTLLERLREFGLEDMNSSMIYRTLRDMEGKEWITSTWDKKRAQGPPRRVYRLAALGDEVLGRYTRELQKTRETVDYFLDAYRRHMEEGEGEHH